MLGLVISRLVAFVAMMAIAAIIVLVLLGIAPGHHLATGSVATAAGYPEWAFVLAFGQNLVFSLSGLARGDFGLSVHNAPVSDLIARAALVSLPLVVAAVTMAIFIGVPLGLLGARRGRSPIAAVLRLLTRVGAVVPNLWLGMVLAILSAVLLRWLAEVAPAFGGSLPTAVSSWLQPVLALALPLAATLARGVCETRIEIENASFITTARARGLTAEEAVRRLGSRFMLLTVLGVVRTQSGAIAAATVAVETVFSLPGLGRLALDALRDRDLALLQGALLMLILAVGVAVLIASLLEAVADPRLRAKGWR